MTQVGQRIHPYISMSLKVFTKKVVICTTCLLKKENYFYDKVKEKKTKNQATGSIDKSLQVFNEVENNKHI